MRVAIAIAALFLVVAMAAQAESAPVRVVSLNLCVDQYLMALADHDQVAALSNYARDPQLSFYAGQAEGFPISAGSVEDVLSRRPDLILAGTSRRQGAVALLRKQGLRVVEIRQADNYPGIVAETRQIATLLGQTARGEAVIAKMEAALAVIPQPAEPKLEAAYYQRRGYLAGANSLEDEVMRRAGFANLATRLGRASVAPMPLEVIIAARPDYLIIDSEADPHSDNGSAMLFHPALTSIIPPERRLTMPRAMVACGGPFFPDAVARLAAEIAKRPKIRSPPAP